MRLPVRVEDLVRSIQEDLPSGTTLDRLHAAVELADQANALGDGLVGHFVEAARSEGCSWAQIGSELGVSKQAAQQRFVTRPIAGLTARLRPIRLVDPRTSRRGFFSRFTAGAREVITAAQEEARQLGHDSVQPEHLFLALLRDTGGRPARALRALGIDAEPARTRLVEMIGPTDNESNDSPPFAPEAKKVLELSLREGLRSQAKEVAPEHILLGAVAHAEAAGAQVLATLGATPDAVRQALREVD
jgi:hypothetical protein